MDPSTCNQRIQDLQTQLDQLKDEHAAKSDSRQALDLPAIKQDFINQILTNLKAIVGAVPPSQKKHLLHLLVKKVLIIDSQTAETWYCLPQESPVRTLSYMVPLMGQYANHYSEVIFSGFGSIQFA
jgi:hypothetical protein